LVRRGAARPTRVGVGLLAAALIATVAAQHGPVAAAPSAEVRAAHATEQLAVLRRAAELSVGIDRIGQDYLWPLEGRISSPFGWRMISVAGNRFHGGIDIAAPTGTPVRSARGGVVTRAGWVGAYGFLVIVDHGGGWETRYAHLSRIDVTVGQRLAQSAIVGLVGSTGASTGPHLHFEVRREGLALDPLAYLAR
jgi:murein DD-endopeptidase MepM/ murein hydrolase activator NlpD